jgi:hypothetical protein
MSKLTVVPMTLRKANDFVEKHHRHSGRTSRDGGKWAIGASLSGQLIGVAIAGRPLARLLDDGWTLEVTRCCVLPEAPKGASSFLYGACRRIWQSMGGKKILTYTLATESGASLRGAGWEMVSSSKGHKNGWFRADSPHCKRRHQELFGQLKFRWESDLTESDVPTGGNAKKGGDGDEMECG